MEETKNTDTISLLDIVLVMVKNIKFIFWVTFFSGLILIFLLVLSLKLPSDSVFNFFPNRYKPEAVILLKPPGNNQGGFSSLMNNSDVNSLVGILGGGISSTSAIGELVNVLIFSNEVIDYIVSKYNLIEIYKITKFPLTNSRKNVKDNLFFEIDSISNTAILSYLDTDPELGTNIVNSLVTYVEKKVKNIYLEQTYEKRIFLQDRLDIKEVEFAKLQDALIEFQKKYEIINVDSLTTSSVSLISGLQTEIITQERKLKSLEKLSPHADTEIGILKFEIESTQALIDELKSGGDNYSNEFIPLDNLPTLTAEYLNMKQELTLQGVILEMLKQQFEAVKIEESDKSQSFIILQEAEIPEVKTEPRRSILVIITLFTVFMITVFISFIKEYLASVKKDPEESGKLESIKKALFFLRQKKH